MVHHDLLLAKHLVISFLKETIKYTHICQNNLHLAFLLGIGRSLGNMKSFAFMITRLVDEQTVRLISKILCCVATLAVRAQTLQTEDERLYQEHVWPEDRARSTELPGRTLFHIPGADIRKTNKQTSKQTKTKTKQLNTTVHSRTYASHVTVMSRLVHPNSLQASYRKWREL